MICKDKLSDRCHNRDLTYSWYLILQKVHILAKIKNCVFPVSFWKRKHWAHACSIKHYILLWTAKSYTGKKICIHYVKMVLEQGCVLFLKIFKKKRGFTEIRPYSENSPFSENLTYQREINITMLPAYKR